MHLTVGDSDLCLGDIFFEIVVHSIDSLHPVVDKKDLTITVDFTEDYGGDYSRVELFDFGYYRQA